MTSLEAQAATLDEQMQAAIAKAAANADTARATMRADFDGTIAGFETAHQESTSGFEERASDLVSRIHQQEKRVTDIVNTIGGKAITGGFGEWEASERKSADQLRLFASGTAAVAIVFLVVAASFDWFESDSNNWQGMVGRLGFSALMFALAGYLSREASQHRANANYARRLAIELTSIGPFVHDNLDEAEGLKMLAEFTKNVFGRAEPPSVKKANGLRPGRSTAALKDDA